MVRNHAYDESSKTRQGGIDDTATNYEKIGRMYETDHQNDGFNALQLYCSLICPKSTSHTIRSANASLPREPALTSTIWIRRLCYDS